jgi:probable O-glycosylation ligase (exosortase A-associated)
MLRSIFVLILIGVGGFYALQSPFYSLLFYIGNAYFRPEDWVWSDFVSSLKLSLLSGALVMASTLLSKQRLVWNGRILMLWLFLLHTLLSTLGSENFSYSWGYWTDFLKTIIITYLIIVLATEFTKFRLVLLVMVLALGLEQARQGWIYLITSPGWYNPNPLPFLGDNNGVAVGMLMLVPIVGLLGQTTERKWGKAFYWVLLIGCLYRALSTYSRAGFLAAAAMGAIWLLRTRHKTRALVGVVLVIIVVLPALPDAYWKRMQTIETYEEEQDESALGRLHFWKVAQRMANENPLLGVGYNAYNLSYDRYDFSGGAYGSQRSVHSSPLGLVAELGYMGAFLFALVVFGALRSCSRVRKLAFREAALSDLDQSAIVLQTSLVAFLVGGSFVIFQYNEMLWHFLGLTIALERLAVQRREEMLSGKDLKNISRSAPSTVPSAA